MRPFPDEVHWFARWLTRPCWRQVTISYIADVCSRGLGRGEGFSLHLARDGSNEMRWTRGRGLRNDSTEWAGDKRSLLHSIGKVGMILFSFHTQLYYVRTPPIPSQPRPPRHVGIIVPRRLKRLNELIARYALANVGLYDADSSQLLARAAQAGLIDHIWPAQSPQKCNLTTSCSSQKCASMLKAPAKSVFSVPLCAAAVQRVGR